MKHAMLFCMSVIFTAGAVLVFASREVIPDFTLPQLEEQIPFEFSVTDKPMNSCDPLDVDVVMIKGVNGETNYRWRVMDGDEVQMEFMSFNDLYYRCDGPGCFNIRMGKTRRHVCLK